MTTLEYVNYRRKLKCKQQKVIQVPTKLHNRIGKILVGDKTERNKMDANKPELIQLTATDLDFIF